MEDFRFSRGMIIQLLISNGFHLEEYDFRHEQSDDIFEDNYRGFSATFSLDKGTKKEAILIIEGFENELGLQLTLKNTFEILTATRQAILVFENGHLSITDGFEMNSINARNALNHANHQLNSFIKHLRKEILK